MVFKNLGQKLSDWYHRGVSGSGEIKRLSAENAYLSQRLEEQSSQVDMYTNFTRSLGKVFKQDPDDLSSLEQTAYRLKTSQNSLEDNLATVSELVDRSKSIAKNPSLNAFVTFTADYQNNVDIIPVQKHKKVRSSFSEAIVNAYASSPNMNLPKQDRPYDTLREELADFKQFHDVYTALMKADLVTQEVTSVHQELGEIFINDKMSSYFSLFEDWVQAHSGPSASAYHNAVFENEKEQRYGEVLSSVERLADTYGINPEPLINRYNLEAFKKGIISLHMGHSSFYAAGVHQKILQTSSNL